MDSDLAAGATLSELFGMKRPLAVSRLTKIPSTAEELSMLRVIVRSRIFASLR